MKILISGTPGTGKTTVSELLSKKLGFELVKINEFAEEQGLVEGVDTKRGSLIIDEEKLDNAVGRLSGNLVIEGHLAHFCFGDIVVVLRCEPSELEKRLSGRSWPLEKIKENVEAEALDVILQEAVEASKKVIEIDTTGRDAGDVCVIIADIVKSGNHDKYKPGTVSWASYFAKL